MSDLQRAPGVTYQARIGGLMVTLQPGQTIADWLAYVAEIAGKKHG